MDGGEGYYFEVTQDVDSIWSGSLRTNVTQLVQGANVVGFTSVPSGYDAYQLMTAIGDDTVVSSVRRYNTATGRYETAAYHEGDLIGKNFPIHRGTAYVISIKQGVPNVILPTR